MPPRTRIKKNKWIFYLYKSAIGLFFLLLVPRVFSQEPKEDLNTFVLSTWQNLRLRFWKRTDMIVDHPVDSSAIISSPGCVLCRRSFERRLQEFVTFGLRSDRRRGRLLLLCAVIFTWRSWLSHKVNSDVSTYFVANATSSFRLPCFNCMGHQDTEEATVNTNNQTRMCENNKI